MATTRGEVQLSIEAALLGLMLIVWILISPSDQASALGVTRGSGIMLALPVIERLSALAVHVYTCTLIIYAARTRATRWFWFAFAFKSALDAVAAAAVLGFKAPDSLGRYLLLEGDTLRTLR